MHDVQGIKCYNSSEIKTIILLRITKLVSSQMDGIKLMLLMNYPHLHEIIQFPILYLRLLIRYTIIKLSNVIRY